MILSTRERRMLAATLDGEAAHEPPEAMAAITRVILNRAENPRRQWQANPPHGAGPIEATVLSRIGKYGQFSCWNGDRVTKLARYFIGGDPDNGWVSENVARSSRDTLRLILSGAVREPVEVMGCTHYFEPTLASPVWGGRASEAVPVGAHIFLRPDQLTPPERGITPPVVEPSLRGPRADRMWMIQRWISRIRNWSIGAGAVWASLSNVAGDMWGKFVNLISPLTGNPKMLIVGAMMVIVAWAIYWLWSTRHERTAPTEVENRPIYGGASSPRRWFGLRDAERRDGPVYDAGGRDDPPTDAGNGGGRKSGWSAPVRWSIDRR